MPDYVPLDDIIVHSTSSGVADGVDRWHLQVSDNEVVITETNATVTILLTNIGWDKLTFEGVLSVGSNFVIEEDIPEEIHPGGTYPLTIKYTGNAAPNAANLGGLYINVGNSYGNKFVTLTGSDPV